LVYFRRFYIENSFVDFDPRLIGPTCLWIACKVEECVIDKASSLIKLMSTRDDCSFEESDLLLCEFIVLEELNYDLVVYHSYPMLEALATNAELIDSCGNLWRIVNDSYLTDAALRHAPHVVAVACLHVVAHNRQLDLSAWFAKLNVDHAAVWDVVRRVLDLYELCDELRNTPGTTSTAALLALLPLQYVSQPNTPQP